MADQLTFRLPARPAQGRGDFFVSPANAAAADLISRDGTWPMGKLALTGPPGAGKSHLVRVWAAETGARVVGAADLPGEDIPTLAAAGRVAVEDMDRSAGDTLAEEAVFHLHNLLLAGEGRLLITGRSPPAQWRVALPDLASRLSATATATLDPPDDALLAALLVKLFADRQIAVAPPLVAYLVPRIDRSFAAVQSVVETLDRAALAERRPVTRALAQRLLDKPATGKA